MILVGDIGGTKTVLALFSREKGIAGGALHESRFECSRYSSLQAIIREFLEESGARPTAASFGVAGPVKEQQVQVTNLPWVVNAGAIRSAFDFQQVFLLNDLESVATAIPHLEGHEYHTLNPGQRLHGANIGVIAPGTGLGTAFLIWTGAGYKACASEGGHASFSPSGLLQLELLHYLMERYGHVSFERICSGSQLPNIYDFFIDSKKMSEPDWLRQELEQAEDRTPVIVGHALAQQSDICVATLDMFVHVLATVIGNMAVSLLPRAGIFLGGGIPPRILKRLQQPDFLEAVTDKGRFSGLCADTPIHVILEPRTALLGAAWYGLKALAGKQGEPESRSSSA